mgnify:CR=1 FL=1
MRESAVAIATVMEIFNAASIIVVGQMKLTVALTHKTLEVNFLFALYGLLWSLQLSFTILVAKFIIPCIMYHR